VLLKLRNFRIGAAKDVQADAGGFDAESVDRISFSAAASCASACCRSFNGAALPS